MKLRKPVEKLIFSLIFLSIFGCSPSNISKIVDLKCENLRDPLGINTLHPRFSWKNVPGKEGTQQTAYQILVAMNSGSLSEKKANLWNSGKIESSSNMLIRYRGKELQSRQLLYWKVRTWDENGNVSKWSETGTFSIGIVDESDWAASYIGYPTENGFQHCPQFRKVFSTDEVDKDDTYLLHVNSLGYHEVHLNGQKVGIDVLSPAVSQYNKRSLVNTYDVTPYMTAGENNLIIWSGSGWYSKGLPGVVGEGPAVKAQLEKFSGQSAENIVVTDDTWLARNSEYTRISDWMSGRYGGEEVSGNLETQNLAFTEPEKLTWDKASVVEVPQHAVTPQMVEPNRITKEINPSAINKLNDSTFLVDMGTTLAGWFEITFPRLKNGQRVVMEYADHLDERSVDLVNNCYLSVCFGQMADIAGYLGKADDKKHYREKKNQLNKVIHDTFFDVQKGYYSTGSQIDLIFPMLAEAVPQHLRDDLIKTLMERTEKEDNGHLNTGLVGIPVMMEWAAKNNQPGFIYSMLKKKNYPGYLHMLENGATTTWEHWNGARSRIHNCYNGVGQWFYQSVGGIRQIDGKTAYGEFLIDPQIPDGVTWAKTRINTPKGWVSVHWEVTDNRMKMEVEIPVGAVAKVKCPDTGKEISINHRLHPVRDGSVELPSGKYSVEYPYINIYY